MKNRLKKIIKILLGKKFVCKYIEGKHSYQYRSGYWAGEKPFTTKMHITMCDNCKATKRIVV